MVAFFITASDVAFSIVFLTADNDACGGGFIKIALEISFTTSDEALNFRIISDQSNCVLIKDGIAKTHSQDL